METLAKWYGVEVFFQSQRARDIRFTGNLRRSNTIEAFLESMSFEDALRNAVSLGGDSDTIAAITGSIAFAFFDRDPSSRLGDAVLIRRAQYCLTPELRKIVRDFEEFIKE